jgi:hypothetical protein
MIFPSNCCGIKFVNCEKVDCEDLPSDIENLEFFNSKFINFRFSDFPKLKKIIYFQKESEESFFEDKFSQSLKKIKINSSSTTISTKILSSPQLKFSILNCPLIFEKVNVAANLQKLKIKQGIDFKYINFGKSKKLNYINLSLKNDCNLYYIKKIIRKQQNDVSGYINVFTQKAPWLVSFKFKKVKNSNKELWKTIKL